MGFRAKNGNARLPSICKQTLRSVGFCKDWWSKHPSNPTLHRMRLLDIEIPRHLESHQLRPNPPKKSVEPSPGFRVEGKTSGT